MSFRRLAHRMIGLALAAAVLAAASGDRAFAETRLEARYTATLAGIPVGTGNWRVEVSDDQYTAIATGKTSGLVSVFSGGYGSAASQGLIKGGVPQAASFVSNVISGKKTDEVRMTLSGGTVKDLTAEPPMPPVPDRVPVTEAHMRGIMDPMTGGLVSVSGTGDIVTSEVCRRTLPIFDGRGRFDLVLSFKRMARVRAEQGYAGPVVVCGVHYRPIAGHRPNRAAIRYLVEANDIEVWYAPIAGTRILVPFRISVPTVLGPGVLEADTFVATGHPARAGAAPTNVKTQ